MGREARLNKERREKEHQEKERREKELQELRNSGFSDGSIAQLILLNDQHESVYRFFQEDWQADALVKGEVWLSTLEACRSYEHPEQGDSDEASETYYSGHAVGGSNDADFVEIARRTGIHIGPGCSNITISNNTRVTKLPDAYVLCMTKEYIAGNLEGTFGKYCVEITNPRQFFIDVSEQLQTITKLNEGVAGFVIYQNRHFTGLENPPGPIGFVKPPDKYEMQKEFRFLWIPENANNLTPFSLSCPKVRGLCKRIT